MAAKVGLKYSFPSHFEIEGKNYATKLTVFRAAQARGFTGTESNFYYRLQHFALTWASLLRPKDMERSRKCSQRIRNGRDEIAEAIANLDARKAAMDAEE